MSTISPLLARTSNLMSSELLRRRLQETQRELLLAQDQASTGKRLSRGSDAPASISAVLYLNQAKIERGQQKINLEHGSGVLNLADASLRDISDILIDAQQIASSQIGIGSDETTRRTQAGVIDAQLEGAIQAANRKFNGLAIFGGNNGAQGDKPVFESFLGGVRYTGSDQNLLNDVGALVDLPFNSNGSDAFGALSSRVKSIVDLDPQANGQVRLAEIDGARNRGFSPGAIQLTVNGALSVVDLTTADTLDDVVTRINEAITNASPGAGSVSLGAGGYTLTANAGNTITISDPAGGFSAADLGLAVTVASGSVAGGDLNVRLTSRTLLSSLGATVDFTSGMLLSQGAQNVNVDFSGATTVQDLQNEIASHKLGVRLDINEDGTGLNLISEVSGIAMSIGENGGSTATDLGLRTMGDSTLLSDFRRGLGVDMSPAGEPDIEIQLQGSQNFQVDLSSANTVGDVVNLIGAAATAAGLTLGGNFDVQLAANGNGIELTDNTSGASFDFSVSNVGQSFAAEHLGIKQNVGTANTITGTDQSAVMVENVFTHLMELSAALKNNDERGITIAGSKLEDDIDHVVSARARVGVQGRRIEDQLTLIEDRDIQEQTVLSQLQDADLTEVLTRFSQLQIQLQASLQVGSANQQLTLLDFLR